MLTNEKMAQYIRDYFKKLHDQEGYSWEEIEDQTGINLTTANRIANDPPYFPQDQRILDTLGIPPKRKPFESYKDLSSIPPKDLRWMIENRKEF